MSDTMSLLNCEWKKTELEQLTNKIRSGATPRGGSNSFKNEDTSWRAFVMRAILKTEIFLLK